MATSRSTEAVDTRNGALEGSTRPGYVAATVLLLVVFAVLLVPFAAFLIFKSLYAPDARLSLPWAGVFVIFLMSLNFYLLRRLLRLWLKQEIARITKIEEARQTGSDVSQERDAINDLYFQLRQLIARSAADPTLNPEIQRRLARLRALQREEAQKIRRNLNEGLHLKPGTGYQALKEARRLLADHAHPAPQDLPSSR